MSSTANRKNKKAGLARKDASEVTTTTDNLVQQTDHVRMITQEDVSKLVESERKSLGDDVECSNPKSLVKSVLKSVQKLAIRPTDDDSLRSQLFNQYNISFGLSPLYGSKARSLLALSSHEYLVKKPNTTTKKIKSFSLTVKTSSDKTIEASYEGGEEDFMKFVIRAKLAQLWINTAVARGDRDISALKTLRAELLAWIAYAKEAKINYDIDEGNSEQDVGEGPDEEEEEEANEPGEQGEGTEEGARKEQGHPEQSMLDIFSDSLRSNGLLGNIRAGSGNKLNHFRVDLP